jgi:hypothetical protein
MPAAVRLRGRLDIEALRFALSRIVERHESLRTSFAVGADGEPAQVVWDNATLYLNVVDLGDAGDSDERVRAQLSAMAREGFDLGRAPLARARLLKVSESEHVLSVVMHHIISDGWSTGVLVSELVSFYTAYMEGGAEKARGAVRELPVQYADFAIWQNGWLQGDTRTGGDSFTGKYRCCNCRRIGRGRRCRVSGARATLFYCLRRSARRSGSWRGGTRQPPSCCCCRPSTCY